MKFGFAVAVLTLTVAALSIHAAENTGKISGIVKKADGSAAPEWDVQIFAANAQPQRGRKPEPVATAKTDASGNFTLDNVPAGTYRLVAGIPFVTDMAMANVTVKAGAVAKVNVTLKQKGAK